MLFVTCTVERMVVWQNRAAAARHAMRGTRDGLGRKGGGKAGEGGGRGEERREAGGWGGGGEREESGEGKRRS